MSFDFSDVTDECYADYRRRALAEPTEGEEHALKEMAAVLRGLVFAFIKRRPKTKYVSTEIPITVPQAVADWLLQAALKTMCPTLRADIGSLTYTIEHGHGRLTVAVAIPSETQPDPL